MPLAIAVVGLVIGGVCGLWVLIGGVLSLDGPDDAHTMATPGTVRWALEPGAYMLYERVAPPGPAGDETAAEITPDAVTIASADGTRLDAYHRRIARYGNVNKGDYQSTIGFTVPSAGDYEITVVAGRPGEVFVEPDPGAFPVTELVPFLGTFVGFGLSALGGLLLVRADKRRAA